KLYCKDTETLTKGDFANLETGEIDLAATGDTTLLGAIQQTAAGTDSTHGCTPAIRSPGFFADSAFLERGG
ncbi:MAG: hypothetical protein EBV65_11920, partial [Gammaproteobacteria bacterium]|nr:hypothetical protein [Gammaproteobacteria bacterium]